MLFERSLTSPKIHHQKDVTKFSIFKLLP